MTDSDIISFISEFACGFRHELNGRFCLDWLDDNGIVRTTSGDDIRDAVRLAKAARSGK